MVFFFFFFFLWIYFICILLGRICYFSSTMQSLFLSSVSHAGKPDNITCNREVDLSWKVINFNSLTEKSSKFVLLPFLSLFEI